jgi:hypothetical protein
VVAVVKRPITQRDIQAALAGQEAMFGDLREAKGVRQLGVRELPPKREPKPRTLPTEHQEQVAVIHFWRRACHGYGLPEFALYAVPNAGMRSPQQGAWMQAEGLRRGIPDLVLAYPRKGEAGLYVEMKVKPNGRVSPEQRTVMDYLAQFYRVAVCWTADEAIAEIKAYLA